MEYINFFLQFFCLSIKLAFNVIMNFNPNFIRAVEDTSHNETIRKANILKNLQSSQENKCDDVVI